MYKVVVSRIHKELLQLSKTTNNPIKKQMGKNLNRHFFIKEIHELLMSTWRGSISFVIRKVQIKTTVIYHYISTGMSLINKTDNTRWCEDKTKLEPSSTAEMYSHFGKVCQLLKRLNLDLPYGNTCLNKLVLECSQQHHAQVPQTKNNPNLYSLGEQTKCGEFLQRNTT